MDVVAPFPIALPARPVAARWHASGGTLCCLAAMTAGLWVDSIRGQYQSLELCSADASPWQMLALHVALLPVSCLAMYVTTVFAFCTNVRSDGGRRRALIAVGDVSLVTAQVVAGAIIMSMAPFDFAGDGYIRAWFGMAAAMAVAHAGTCAISRIDVALKGKRHAGSETVR